MNTAIALIVSTATMAGWIVLIVVGIIGLRRGQRGLGTGFLVVGGLWGLIILFGTSAAYYYYRNQDTTQKPSVTFSPETFEGPMATLTLDWKQPSTLNVRSKQGKEKYKLEAKDGTFKLPPGTYSIESWNTKATDEKGINWTLETRYPRNLQNIEVKAEETMVLPLANELEASVITGPTSGGSASFSFALKDAAGNEFTMLGSGKGAQPPGFEVTDETDKVVWSGKFEYG